MTKIRINHDSGDVYQDGTIMEASELINDYKECLNDVEDKDTIGWFDNTHEEEAIWLISDLWGMDIEFIHQEKVNTKTMTHKDIFVELSTTLTRDDILRNTLRAIHKDGDGDKPFGYLLTLIRDNYGLPKPDAYPIADDLLKFFNIDNETFGYLYPTHEQ